MIASTTPMKVGGALEGTLFALSAAEAVPPRLPVAIDHPPQLA
jgi:hypothetical protein